MKEQSELLKGDWGTLIVLDACRYDIFKDIVDKSPIEEGTLECVRSNAIGTPQWYINNWLGKRGAFPAALISANPQAFRFGELKFTRTIRAWQPLWFGDIFVPEKTFGFYIKSSYGARAVIHFIPPHLPFIGEEGRKLNIKIGMDVAQPMEFLFPDWEERCVKYGKWEELKTCYAESLVFMMRNIYQWLADFLPPVVITADHGEVIGECGMYGHSHPEKELEDIQKNVPWFVFDDEAVQAKHRLQQLGYV